MAILDNGSSSLKYDILQDYGWVLKKKNTTMLVGSQKVLIMLSLVLEHTQWRRAQEGDLACAEDSLVVGTSGLFSFCLTCTL